MTIAKQIDIRANIKKYFDMAFNGEPIIVPRKENKNVVILSEKDYKELEKAKNNAAYLAVQNYDEEISHLSSKYGLPGGRLYIAFYDGEAAGCVGLRKIDEKNCELKRLYVRSAFRGKHIGNTLIKQIIKDAKEIGYSHMLLDTLPFLTSALCLYKACGFYEIPSYNNSPMSTSIYMKRDL